MPCRQVEVPARLMHSRRLRRLPTVLLGSSKPRARGLVWFGFVWFCLVWFCLVWFGLVWSCCPRLVADEALAGIAVEHSERVEHTCRSSYFVFIAVCRAD